MYVYNFNTISILFRCEPAGVKTEPKDAAASEESHSKHKKKKKKKYKRCHGELSSNMETTSTESSAKESDL